MNPIDLLISILLLPIKAVLFIIDLYKAPKPPPLDDDYSHDIPPKEVYEIKAEEVWKMPAKKPIIDYNIYIKSDAWLHNPVRKAVLVRDNYCCATCSEDLTIEVHHITYESLGNEHPDHLITLCRECHEETHRIAGKGAGRYPPVRKL